MVYSCRWKNVIRKQAKGTEEGAETGFVLTSHPSGSRSFRTPGAQEEGEGEGAVLGARRGEAGHPPARLH